MKQFNLIEYKKNPSLKVVTREGKAVRIICINRDSIYPVVFLCRKEDDSDESVFMADKNGKVWDARDFEDNYDLYFDFNERSMWTFIYDIAADYGGEETLATSLYKNKEDAEEAMKRLHGFGLTEITWEE